MTPPLFASQTPVQAFRCGLLRWMDPERCFEPTIPISRAVKQTTGVVRSGSVIASLSKRRGAALSSRDSAQFEGLKVDEDEAWLAYLATGIHCGAAILRRSHSAFGPKLWRRSLLTCASSSNAASNSHQQSDVQYDTTNNGSLQ